MRKTWALVMAAAMAAASLTACSSSKPAETSASETEAEATGDQQEILVAAAASLQYVMEDKIQPAFEKENPDIKLSFTFDSSGKLQTQIEEGADADVFFSAAMKQMNALEDEGLLVSRGTVGRFVTSDEAALERARRTARQDALEKLAEEAPPPIPPQIRVSTPCATRNPASAP